MAIKSRFLVSFMVDARGGAMRGCRHSGVRVIIPPRKAAMPMRITCRYLKKDKLVHAPPLMEGEALASRILEMGPAAAKFLGPVIIEVPHFASLRGKEREIVILRSDNGETWREHTLEATEEAVQEVLNESFDGEELKQLEDLNTSRITRILTTDFPQYFAIVTRIRQEVHAIGPEGGMVSSTVVPQVQAVFPEGALTKKIKVGLQAQPIAPDLVAKLLGNRVAVSPIVTVEPRRRKFHKPITLTIPVPQAANKGMINQYSGEAPTLRLLCSITGGTTRAQWEDVTGSTPLTFVNDCVSFTTTVSARFWLMDCNNISEATKMATELYREAIHVPFMAKFVVFSKRHQLEEARLRVFCMTDDKEDKTLETQENFVEVAKSRDVEVLEGKSQHLEFAGNLVPITKSGDQLAFNFYAFRENRLPFNVRVKDQHADSVGRVAFMRQPKVGRGDPPQTPICNLNITLPENILPEPAPSEPDLLALGKKYSFLSISKTDTIHKADLRLSDISNMLSQDWVGLARELEISDSDINIIKSQYPDNAPQQAIVMLRLWMQTSGNKATGNTLEKGLRKIGRDDIVNQCIFNVELVTDDMEKAVAKEHLDHSGFDLLKTGLGPSKGTPLRRDMSMDVSYDEQDIMKEGESGEEDDSLNQKPYQDKPGRIQPTAADLSPTYEREEKKYAGEEKDVPEEKEKSQRIEEVKKEEDSQVKVIKNEVEEIKKTESNKEVTEKTESKTEISTTIKDGEKTTTKVTTKKTEDGVEKTTLITTSKVEEAEGTAVSDVMVSEKKTSNVVQETTEADKKQLLMKLGEELGKLDEQLEAKFKEKSKPEDPQEGFTQTSVEQSQTILPADVSPSAATEVLPPSDPASKDASFHISTGTSEQCQSAESSRPTLDSKEKDGGVVFTESVQYEGEYKPTEESTDGQTHTFTPSLDPYKQSSLSSRPTRRHERTLSQSTNILTETFKKESFAVSTENADSIPEKVEKDLKPYSERKQFWEHVSTQSSDSKQSSIIKSETESDTDTGTDGTVVEQNDTLLNKHKRTDTSESETEPSQNQETFYDNAGFMGSTNIDRKIQESGRPVSPYEVLRKNTEPVKELPSPEDVALKDVKTKREIFETEIKRQSMEIEESLSWKRSSKEYDDDSLSDKSNRIEELPTEEDACKRKESHSIKEKVELQESLSIEDELTKDDEQKPSDFKLEKLHSQEESSSKVINVAIASNKTVLNLKEQHSTKSSKDSFETSSSLTTSGVSDSQTSSFEKSESQMGSSFDASRTDSSESKVPTSLSTEGKTSTLSSSIEDHDISDDITKTEQKSEVGIKSKVAQNVEEERRILGDTQETVVRETTTTLEGSHEQRIVKETKTQETLLSDGSTVKSTSITTFTTQLDKPENEKSKSDLFSPDVIEEIPESYVEDKDIYKTDPNEIKPETFIKDKMKSDIFKEEISSSKDVSTLEHKNITDSIVQDISTSVRILNDKVDDTVWETSQQVSEVIKSETVEEIITDKIKKTNVIEDSTLSKLGSPEKIKLSEEEARNIALEIVNEVKSEALKRSPVSPQIERASFPKPSSDSAFTLETSNKIEKYIQEQLGSDVDERQLSLLEKISANKTAALKKSLASGYQISLDITDEDLRSSGAELSPIEHQMEKLRIQMNDDDDVCKSSLNDASEADESENSLIIHDIDENTSTEYDQATEMITKTLTNVSSLSLKSERIIETITEEPPDEIENEKKSKVSDNQKIKRDDVKETAIQIVKEVTKKAQDSEVIKSLNKSLENLDSEEQFQEKTTSVEKIDSSKTLKEEFIKPQRSFDSHREHMETSMTESMEEYSAAESTRAYESKMYTEVSRTTIHEGKETDGDKSSSSPESEHKQIEKRSSTSSELDSLRKDSKHKSKAPGTDFETCSSSGESHYATAAEGTSGSRPCSSDVEGMLSGTTGTSEYDTALTSQETSHYSSVSQDYHTAASSISSRDSMRSIDSESSGNLASIELSEASETLVPSALELEKDMDLLDQELMEEELSQLKKGDSKVIPVLTVQSETPKSEGVPSSFDLDSEGDTEADLSETSISSKMKRSVEMTFHPKPEVIHEDTTQVSQVKQDSSISKESNTSEINQSSESSKSSTTVKSSSKQTSRMDSGVVTTSTEDSNIEVESVTITATTIPATSPGEMTSTISTQVTSQVKLEEKTEHEQFFRSNGPTEVEYNAEYDNNVSLRPVNVPSEEIESEGTLAGRSAGPEINEECYETEADQEYGHMRRESEFSDMAEAELQYTIDDQPESEIDSLLGVQEPLERPRTPEPGHIPPSLPTQTTVDSINEPEELTEVDKQFSAIFGMTYDSEDDEDNLDLPNITVTEHMSPIPFKYRYPDLEREQDFPECQILADMCSPSTASSVTSPKSTTTDSDQGREYCLDSMPHVKSFEDTEESFEIIDSTDIDKKEYNETMMFHEKRLNSIEEGNENGEIKNDIMFEKRSMVLPPTIKAVKIDTQSISSSDTQSLEGELDDQLDSEYAPSIEEQRRWLERQFEESNAQPNYNVYDYAQQSYMDHVYSGPLEDIEEEKEDMERKDLSHLTKNSSLSSTPEFDVLAGKKFFTRSGEHDDISMSSLQEFERLEREMAIENAMRRSSSGSQESLNGRKSNSRSTQGDDISVGSFSSLKEFERLEADCKQVEQIETTAQKEESMLSEIEEGHESQISESESYDNISEHDQDSEGDPNYNKQLFEIDEIIRQAQRNVQTFQDRSPSSEYRGVQLKDIVSTAGSGEGNTPEDFPKKVADSFRQDSLEKPKTKQNDCMNSSVDSLEYPVKVDSMSASTDSLENKKKRNEQMITSTDSIEPCRKDNMTTSIDSLGRDDSSGRDADISSGSEYIGRQREGGIMEWSTDSLEPSSSQATHATYQFESDSVMSGSFASGCSNTLLASMEEYIDPMTASVYIPEGEFPELSESREKHKYFGTQEVIEESIEDPNDSEFSKTIKRTVTLPPEAHQVYFKGPDSEQKMAEFIESFGPGEQTQEEETIDSFGNVHIQKVVQKRIVINPENIQDYGLKMDNTNEKETMKSDGHGNITRIVRKTVISTETMNIDLETGEPILDESKHKKSVSKIPVKTQPSSESSTTQSKIPVFSTRSPKHSTTHTSPPPPTSPRPTGPSLGWCGPHQSLSPSLESDTISGDVQSDVQVVSEPISNPQVSSDTRIERGTKEEEGQERQEEKLKLEEETEAIKNDGGS